MGRTCEGCPYIVAEPAGKGYDLYICYLGKFDYPKGAVEHVPTHLGGKLSAEIPSWCKLGKGKRYDER